jgi:hypothetical protein
LPELNFFNSLISQCCRPRLKRASLSWSPSWHSILTMMMTERTLIAYLNAAQTFLALLMARYLKI